MSKSQRPLRLVLDAGRPHSVTPEEVRLDFIDFELNQDRILRFAQIIEENPNLSILKICTPLDCDLGHKQYEPIHRALANLPNLETVILDSGWCFRYNEGGTTKWRLAEPIIDAIAQNKSVTMIEMNAIKDVAFPHELFRQLMPRLFPTSSMVTRSLVVHAVRCGEDEGDFVEIVLPTDAKTEASEQPLSIHKLSFSSSPNANILSVLATFFYPHLETVEVKSRSLLPPSAATDLRAILERAPHLSCLEIGPVGPNQGPSKSPSLALWSGGTMGSPDIGDLGDEAFREIAQGLRATDKTLKHCLTLRLIDGGLDEEAAATLREALQTRFERRCPTTLHIKGGGLGYAMRCGRDHYHYTNLQPILRSCVPWVTRIYLDCYLSSSEFSQLLQLQPSQMSSLEEIRFSFQRDVDLHQCENLLSHCRKMSNLQRLVVRYHMGRFKLVITPKDWSTPTKQLLGRADPPKAQLRGIRDRLVGSVAPHQLLNAFPDIENRGGESPPSDGQPFAIQLEESVSVVDQGDGGKVEVLARGVLMCTSLQEAGDNAVVQVDYPREVEFTFSTHPKFDRKLFGNESKLAIKNGKPYPRSRPVGVFRWSASQSGQVDGPVVMHEEESGWLDVREHNIPIAISCSSHGTGREKSRVRLQLTVLRPDLVLRNIKIVVLLGTNKPPAIKQIDSGTYKHDPNQGMLGWYEVAPKDQRVQTLEFEVPTNPTGTHFPLQAMFQTEEVLCPGLRILAVANTKTGLDIPYQVFRKPVKYTLTLGGRK